MSVSCVRSGFTPVAVVFQAMSRSPLHPYEALGAFMNGDTSRAYPLGGM
jgi:hypothetical protein